MKSNLLIVAVLFWPFHISAKSVNVKSTDKATIKNHRGFVPELQTTFKVLATNVLPSNLIASAPPSEDEQVKAAITFFSKYAAGIDQSEVHVDSHHTTAHNGITHVYLRQVINGIPVDNGVANLNMLKDGRCHSLGNSFYTGPRPSSSSIMDAKHSPTDAVTALAELLNVECVPTGLSVSTVNGVNANKDSLVVKGVNFVEGKTVPAELRYLQTQDGELHLVWRLQADTGSRYYNALVDVHSNNVLSIVDYVSDATYNVLPLGLNDPNDGKRKVVVDPENKVASPKGWHTQGDSGHEKFTLTIGNNVYAQDNPDGLTSGDILMNHRPSGGSKHIFDFKMDLKNSPDKYVDASVTQLFYMNNIIHDITYMYGFDEAAGNFQENNFGNEGEGGDAIIATTQDGADFNNAQFFSPPDGSKGRMRMFVFDVTKPNRDGTLDNGIVTHEYFHGVSTRLTGGRTNPDCLPGGTSESGGMGEGWSDIFGIIWTLNESTKRNRVYRLGEFVLGQPGSTIRPYPYSTDMKINPTTYSYVLKQEFEWVHEKGSVWANMLYEIYFNLVEKHGFDPDWYNTNPDRNQGGLKGNIIFAQLLIDGMKIQPCRPNFLQARDAIIEADQLNNKGDNFKEIWKGFAKRGLGSDAAYQGIDGFKVPDKYEKPKGPGEDPEKGDNGAGRGNAGITLTIIVLITSALRITQLY